MKLFSLIYGLIMIGAGFLVKAAPGLISGYNTMPEDQKKNVDIEGLSTYLRNGFITIGLTVIIGYYLFNWIGISFLANSVVLIATLMGLTVMVLKAQRFDHNREKKTKSTYIILTLVIVFVTWIISYGYTPSRFAVDNDTLNFSGMYGFDIKISDIKSIEIAERIPVIKSRSNGFSLGNIKKGYFELEGMSKCRLLLHSSKQPYIVITQTNNKKIIVNFSDKFKTEDVYNTINNLIKSQAQQ